MMIPKERPYEVCRIEQVQRAGKSGWTVGVSTGYSLYIPKTGSKKAPKIGDKISLYGWGLGYAVRGIVINRRVYRYVTEEVSERQRERELAKLTKEKTLKWTEGYPAFIGRVDRLPDPLKLRMQGFLAVPGWGPDQGAYELFCCEQSVEISNAVKDFEKFDANDEIEALTKFRKMPSSRQKELVPGLDDGHSGNTFGMSCRLASLLLQRPDLVELEHCALCPIMGCTDAGCAAGRTKAAA